MFTLETQQMVTLVPLVLLLLFYPQMMLFVFERLAIAIL